ncbi:hypothetical protein [Chryseobacterium pennipullorum]|uniref:Uncharacterized protein n=1 Tax=Chryseobacterium pennipullorum TaxID=2258963 RepID=A0A3D9ATW2_9FLAO|nr:hypothetical protein [Chryseobacterium pennipullorum]REC44791.1 hypothetical protein DRF67_17115 [Chryseobacterium pennipullorum]
MQNIQDLKEKIFFESKNIIDNLDKINNVDELLSKQDLVDELANRISFLKLLEKNIEYFVADQPVQHFEKYPASFSSGESEYHDSGNEVTEEEAIFNNELNEIDENENFADESREEEAVFSHQLDDIIENEFHENIVSFAEQNEAESKIENSSPNGVTEEEAVFNNQLNEIEEEEDAINRGGVFSFVDEEKILADAEPDSSEDINEEMFHNDVTEEEAVFNNQLNEIDDDETESTEPEGKRDTDFAATNAAPESMVTETIPSIFDTEMLDDEILIEENEEPFISSNVSLEQGEMATDTSNVENILNDIKNDHAGEELKEERILAEVYDRRKIVEIDKPAAETEKHPSDLSFEDLEAYNQEKKIKLANIKGLKAVQSLFDDDPLEREVIKEKETSDPVAKDETGSILKSNIPTHLMEAEKQKPEFRLDLNDKIAFSKMLFEGSQTDLNDTVAMLNHFKTLEEAKEYLSDLYYERKWSKVDEYAQRLWILVENKFL